MRTKITRLVAGLGAVAVIALAGVAASLEWFSRSGTGNGLWSWDGEGPAREFATAPVSDRWELVGQAWNATADVAAPMLMVAVAAAVFLLTWVAVQGDQ